MQELKQKVKVAKRLYDCALDKLYERRDQLPRITSPALGELWACSESEKQRHIQRMEQRMQKVLQLEDKWKALEARYHDQRVAEAKLAALEESLAVHRELEAALEQSQSIAAESNRWQRRYADLAYSVLDSNREAADTQRKHVLWLTGVL